MLVSLKKSVLQEQYEFVVHTHIYIILAHIYISFLTYASPIQCYMVTIISLIVQHQRWLCHSILLENDTIECSNWFLGKSALEDCL